VYEIHHKPGWGVWLGLLGLALAACGSAPAAGSHQAGLAVVHGDGSVETACVAFSEPEISGLELLERAGLQISLDAGNPMGALVCQVQGEGCGFPGQACLCQCPAGGPCHYWAYFSRAPQAGWIYASNGASARQVHPGDVDAWVWLATSGAAQAIPAPLSRLVFEDICPGTASPSAP
jgi:hypothetical protein